MASEYLNELINSIEFIENNLDKSLKISDVSDYTGFSLFHFHRVFVKATGESIKEYILKRKLSEASKELLGTKKKIIDISFDYGYENPETFSRSFRKLFGISPSQYRKNKKIMFRKERIEPEVLKHLIGGIDMEPNVINIEPRKIVGMKYKGSMGHPVLNDLWGTVNSRVNEVKNIVGNGYGLNLSVEEKEGDFLIEYIAGFDVSDYENIPEGMERYDLPGGKYLVFEHKGHVSKTPDTFEYIYGTYLPKSDYEKDNSRPDFEYYDQDFNCETEAGKFYIYVPIK
ncbi:MAG: AraC family transcriptional regulator [Thermotogota bacterium]